jgi:biopolymer transport protein ExbB/TolQ
MKKIKYSLIIIIIILINLTSIPAFSQDTLDAMSAGPSTTDSLSLAQQQSNEVQMDTGKRGFNIKTMYELFKIAKGFGYFLALTFILGILFIFQKWLVLIREKNDAQKIPVKSMKTMSYDDITKMFTKVKEDNVVSIDEEDKETEKVPLLKKIFRRKKATAFQLLHKLYKIFDTQKTTISFNEETSSFIQYLKDMFNPFLTRLSFLSDTAGALGLLGTVWGMFLVFYRGSPDPEDTLQGMGIALSTTIIGLVISIILNSFTTIVSNLFDKHLDFVNNMSAVFQERMMKEEEKQPAKMQPIVVDSIALSDRLSQQPIISQKRPQLIEDEEEQRVQKPEIIRPVYGPPAKVKIISGDNQTGEVNTQLSEPIIVEVQDANGNLLENETVIFTAENGAGMFSNNNRVQKILTDDEGRAKTQFTLGKTTGEKTIHISVDGSDNRGIKLLAIAKPTPPTKMIELKGNYQTGELGKRLPIPFTVAIRDRYDNPIPMYEVDFSMKKGTGRFQDTQNAHFTAHTNEDGLVQVYFIVGNDRGAREVEVEAKKVEPSKIIFEAFAI